MFQAIPLKQNENQIQSALLKRMPGLGLGLLYQKLLDGYHEPEYAQNNFSTKHIFQLNRDATRIGSLKLSPDNAFQSSEIFVKKNAY